MNRAITSVPPPVGTSRNDQFYRFLRFYGASTCQYTSHRCRPAPLLHMVLLLAHLQCSTPRCFSRAARLFVWNKPLLIRVISTARKSGSVRFFLQGHSEGGSIKASAHSNVCTASFRGFVASEAILNVVDGRFSGRGFSNSFSTPKGAYSCSADDMVRRPCKIK